MKSAPTHKLEKLVFYGSLLLCVGSLTLASFLTYSYWRDQTRREQMAFDNAKSEAFLAAVQINREFTAVAALTKNIANELDDGTLSSESVADRLKSELGACPASILGLGVAFEPFVHQADTRLYAPYYLKDQRGVFQLIQVEDFYDYTMPLGGKPNTVWYHQPLTEGPGWIEPFFGSASDTLLTVYGAPFYRTDPESLERVAAGVAFATISLDGVERLIECLDLGATGYGYVLSKRGLLAAHPIEEYVGHTTIFELAESLQDEEMHAEGERAIRGEIFSRDAIDEITGQSSWIFHEPIPSTGWSVGIVLNKDELALNPRIMVRQLIHILLASMAFLFFLSILLFRPERGNARGLWGVAISFSVLCILGMVTVWRLSSFVRDEQGIKIVDRATLDKFLAFHARQESAANPSPQVYVPTGVFVQTIRLHSPNNVAVSGYIWQKYADDVGEEISRGFVLPQIASGMARPVIEEPSIHREGGMEIYRWRFIVTLRQPFDPAKYPFEQENISLRLWHQDLGQNVILTPDLDAYDLIKPAHKPGLDEEVFWRGWYIDNSFFSYKAHSYNSNFGAEHFVGQTDAPELHFNISLHRNIVDPLVAYIIPLTVVTCMVFAVLAVPRERETKNMFSGLSYCAAMFFAVAVAHNGLRGRIAAQGMTYLEYFYILMYVTILAVSANIVLVATQADLRLVQYQDNLVPKLLYWPIFLGTLLGITLATFYP